MRSFVSRPVIYPMAASVKKHFVLLCFVLWFSASVSAVKAGSGALDAPGPVLWDPCITSRDVRRLKVQSHYMAVSVCTQVAKTLGVWIIFYPPNSQSSPTRFCQPCPTAYPSQAPVSCDSAEGMSTTISRSDLRPHSLDSEQQVQSCRIDSLVPQQCKAVCDLLVKLHPTGWCFDRHFAATTGCMDQKADWHPPTGVLQSAQFWRCSSQSQRFVGRTADDKRKWQCYTPVGCARWVWLRINMAFGHQFFKLAGCTAYGKAARQLCFPAGHAACASICAIEWSKRSIMEWAHVGSISLSKISPVEAVWLVRPLSQAWQNTSLKVQIFSLVGPDMWVSQAVPFTWTLNQRIPVHTQSDLVRILFTVIGIMMWAISRACTIHTCARACFQYAWHHKACYFHLAKQSACLFASESQESRCLASCVLLRVHLRLIARP